MFSDTNYKYTQIIQKNKELSQKLLPLKKFKIKILSNIVVEQLNEVLEFYLRDRGVSAYVESGSYDNIIQDSMKLKDENVVIVFWSLLNLSNTLYIEIEQYNDNQLTNLYENLINDINCLVENLKQAPLVLFNTFSSIHQIYFTFNESNLEKLTNKLNQYILSLKQMNLRVINTNKIIGKIGIDNALDDRNYYYFRAPYTINFYKNYSLYIMPFILSINGNSKKALIFDCDNTLWKGILGEDGFEHIDMSTMSKEGFIYAEVQNIAVNLSKKGVIIGICTKNNSLDIAAVFKSHPDIILKEKYIAIIKSNWSDKDINLQEISKDLNIGLDSLVYIDDSPFEINLIRKNLPSVTTYQVPKQIYDYPKLMWEISRLFYFSSNTSEDENKSNMLKQSIIRENLKKQYNNIDSYLADLEIQTIIYINESDHIQRAAQLCQKTNQFNLTTIRHTEGKINELITTKGNFIFTVDVKDKYGESGITGLCIVNVNSKSKIAEIDSFLLSCRILGRNIETVFLDYVISYLNDIKIKTIVSKYCKTEKNEQVIDFYDRHNFKFIKISNQEKFYRLNIRQYKPSKIKYITVIYGNKN